MQRLSASEQRSDAIRSVVFGRIRVDRRRFDRLRQHRWYLDVTIVVVAMVAAAIVFASQINAEGLWQDEGATASYTALPLSEWARIIALHEPHNGVYYVLIRIWASVFGLSETALRSFSLLAGVATIPFIYLIGRRLGGILPAFAAIALFVVNPFVLNYAVEARTYSLAMLLTTAATWLLLRASGGDDRRGWILYAVVMTAAVWTHFYAVFIVPAQLLWILTIPKSKRRGGLVAVGAVLLSSVPMGVAIVLWSTERNWINPPTLISVVNRLLQVIGVRRPGLLSTALGVCYLVALGVVSWALVRERLAVRRDRAAAQWNVLASARALVVLWAVVPIALGVLVSLIQPLFISRSLIVMLPALFLLFAAALPLLRFTWVSVVGLSLVLAVTFSQATINVHNSKPDFRGAFEAIASQASNGDRVLVYPGRLIWRTAGYYMERLSGLDGVELLNTGNVSRKQAARLVADAGQSRIWLVIFDGSLDEPPLGLPSVLRQLNERGFQVESTQGVRRFQVALFAPRESP